MPITMTQIARRAFACMVVILMSLHASALRPNPSSARSPEESYFVLKQAGKYAEALDLLHAWTMELDDPAGIEINLFRIRELLAYPELYHRGLDALVKIRARAGAKNPFLRDRIDETTALLYLKKGDLRSAGIALKNLSFMNFQAMGPFKSGTLDEFEKSYPPELGYDRKQTCSGRIYPVSWFPASPDRTGVININDLYPDVRDSFFYFSGSIRVHQPGEYYLILGKTGFTDLWLDGARIFSDREEHGFDHGQYFIRVHLPAGPHRLLMKAGDAEEGIQVSLRVASAEGKRTDAAPAEDNGIPDPGSARSVSYFPSLAALMKQKDPSPESLFLTGYLLVSARLGIHGNNRAVRHLSAVPESHPRFASACYYMAKSEKSPEARDRLLKKSIQSGPKNLEPARELADLKISRNFLYEASPLIDMIKNGDPNSPWHPELMARLFIKLGLYPEAMRHAAILNKSRYPSSGCALEMSIYRAEGDYYHALQNLDRLIQLDRFDLSYYQSAIFCHEKTGAMDAAERLCTGAIALYPNSIGLKLRLAEIVEAGKGPGATLPYLSAAHEQAPGNRDVLRALGTAYHKLGNSALAGYWLSLASDHDPDNYQLKQYLKAISGGESEIERHAVKTEIAELAAPAANYRGEPAVVLLDETVISVNADGSFERWVRKLVMVNAQSEVRNFNNQYIVLSPEDESVESLSCGLIHNMVRAEISERYRKSLSDPESRLYYNREAIIIPIPSLVPGDIVDLRYVIKNRSGAEYKQYFGEKITAGDSYRTMQSRTVLIHPSGKPVYCRTRGIEPKALAVEKTRLKTVYRISMNNIAPYKKERAMPHTSQILPAVCFTSHRTWNEFHAWYKSLLKNRIRIDADMKEALRKIIADGDAPLERTRKIYGYITESIRYVGFEFGVGGIQPRSTDITFHTKMGDCKDVSLLLVALLREAGVDARLALLRTRDKGAADLSLPFAGEFNHAACYVNIDTGFFIDATSTHSGIRELPADDRDVDALVIDESGWRIINTGSGFYLADVVEVANTVSITKAGDADIRRSLLKQGGSAPYARQSLKDPSRLVRDLNEYWNAAYPGSSVRDLTIASHRTDEPVRYSYAVSVPSFSRIQDDEIIFDAFITKSDFYQAYAVPKSRVFPIVLSGAWVTKTSAAYAVPEGYRIDRIPASERYDHGSFSADFTYTADRGLITVKSVIEMKKRTIEASEYQRFREFARFIDKKERESIVLVRKP
jgi:tetratricopeptide (TPR) repeat protein